MTGGVIFLIVVLLVVVGVAFYAVSLYNGFVRSRNLIQESWRQIDVELNRRYDLIPNLVETVRAYAAHERNTLEGITRLRNQAAALAQGSHGEVTQERAQVEEQLSGAVRNLLVSVEAYPDLKSNVNFLELQRELTATEDRIAAGRRFYNANVRNYNTQVESFPSNVLAGMFKFEKATYFEVNEAAVRQAPHVSFGEISDRPAGAVPEPTNDQLAAGSAQSALPNPQAYPQANPAAPAPGEFAPAPQPPTYAPPAVQQAAAAPAAADLPAAAAAVERLLSPRAWGVLVLDVVVGGAVREVGRGVDQPHHPGREHRRAQQRQWLRRVRVPEEPLAVAGGHRVHQQSQLVELAGCDELADDRDRPGHQHLLHAGLLAQPSDGGQQVIGAFDVAPAELLVAAGGHDLAQVTELLRERGVHLTGQSPDRARPPRSCRR